MPSSASAERLSATLRRHLARFEPARFAREWWDWAAPVYAAGPGADAQVKALLLEALEPFNLAQRAELLRAMGRAAPAVAHERERRRRLGR